MACLHLVGRRIPPLLLIVSLASPYALGQHPAVSPGQSESAFGVATAASSALAGFATAHSQSVGASRFVTSVLSTSTAAAAALPSPPATSSMAPALAASAISTDAVTALSGSYALDTHLDAAFGLLGAFLILSGLTLAFTGSAYKRLSVFLITVYSFAIITIVLILHFGIEQQISQPSEGIECAFFVACLAAGIIAGVASVIFHRGAKMAIAPVAGFLFGLILQGVRDDGLIRPLGFRYLLYLGLTGAAFVAGCIPRYFDAVILASTAFLGALAFALGVDCFSAENLKEFYIFNLGFAALWPRLDGRFAITSAMQIELGVILLVFVVGMAVQIRFFNVFESRLLSLLAKKSSRAKTANEEEKAASRIASIMDDGMEKFEHRYTRGFPFVVPKEGGSPYTSHQHSPSLPSQSLLATPSTESAPLLPELTYVSKGRLPTSRPDLHVKTASTGLASLGHYSPELAGTDMAVFEKALTESPKIEGADLASEILEKQKALDEIAKLRQNIGQIRDSLRPQSSGSSGAGTPYFSTDGSPRFFPPSSPPPMMPLPSPPAPAASSATPRRQSVSFNDLPEARPSQQTNSATLRPISQHSMIVTQARPMSQCSLSSQAGAQAQSVRPAPPQHTVSAPQVSTAHHRPSYKPDDDRPPPRQQRRKSSTAFLPPSIGAASIPEVQRIITGVLPRSSSQLISPTVTASLPRTQTMDIRDLEARHRRRLSEMQGSSVNKRASIVSDLALLDKTNTAGLGELQRKRSSTIDALSKVASQPARRDASASRKPRIDDFGRLDETVQQPPALSSISKVSPIASGAPAVPISGVARPEKAPQNLKRSDSDWLRY